MGSANSVSSFLGSGFLPHERACKSALTWLLFFTLIAPVFSGSASPSSGYGSPSENNYSPNLIPQAICGNKVCENGEEQKCQDCSTKTSNEQTNLSSLTNSVQPTHPVIGSTNRETDTSTEDQGTQVEATVQQETGIAIIVVKEESSTNTNIATPVTASTPKTNTNAAASSSTIVPPQTPVPVCGNNICEGGEQQACQRDCAQENRQALPAQTGLVVTQSTPTSNAPVREESAAQEKQTASNNQSTSTGNTGTGVAKSSVQSTARKCQVGYSCFTNNTNEFSILVNEACQATRITPCINGCNQSTGECWLAPPTSNTRKPLILYSFNGDFKDSSGNNFHGTSNGALIVNEGVDGKAASFNNSFVYNTDFPWKTGGETTIMFWMKLKKSEVKNAMVFSIGSQESPNRFLAAPWSDGILYWDYGTYTTGRTFTDYKPYMDKWTHIALVSRGNNGNYKAIYVNGELATEGNVSDGPDAPLTGVSVGRGTGNNQWYYYNGLVDEFRVYNTLLTSTQVKETYEEQKNRLVEARVVAPVWRQIPDRKVSSRSGPLQRLVDLREFVYDEQESNDELTFFIGQSDASLLNCFIEEKRYLSCSAPAKIVGKSTISITAKNSSGLSSLTQFSVSVGFVPNNPPVISRLPSVAIKAGSSELKRFIDLQLYTSDNETPDAELSFGIGQSNSALIACYIEEDKTIEKKFVSCTAPAKNKGGASIVTILVRDGDGAEANSTFTITVEGPVNSAPVCRLERIEFDEHDKSKEVVLKVNGSDADGDSINEAFVDWGDGVGNGLSNPSSLPMEFRHTYTGVADTYTISFNVTDNRGMKSSECAWPISFFQKKPVQEPGGQPPTTIQQPTQPNPRETCSTEWYCKDSTTQARKNSSCLPVEENPCPNGCDSATKHCIEPRGTIFSEDFGSSSGWVKTGPKPDRVSGWNWAVMNGAARFWGDPPSSFSHEIYGGKALYSKEIGFSFGVKFEGAENAGVNIFLSKETGVDPHCNPGGYFINFSYQLQSIGLYKYVDCEHTKTLAQVPFGIQNGVWYEVKAQRNANGEWVLFVDGKQVATAIDSEFTSFKKIVLTTYNVARQWEFDSVRVFVGSEGVNPPCYSHLQYLCNNGDVHWFDSCGNIEDKKEECNNNNLACVLDSPGRAKCNGLLYFEPHATTACYDNDAWWFNSLGGRQEAKEECGKAGCSDKKCNAPTGTPIQTPTTPPAKIETPAQPPTVQPPESQKPGDSQGTYYVRVDADNLNNVPLANVYVFVDGKEEGITNAFGYSIIGGIKKGNHEVTAYFKLPPEEGGSVYSQSKSILVDKTPTVASFKLSPNNSIRKSSLEPSSSGISKKAAIPIAAIAAASYAVVDVVSVGLDVDALCSCVHKNSLTKDFGLQECGETVRACLQDGTSAQTCASRIRNMNSPLDTCPMDALAFGIDLGPGTGAGIFAVAVKTEKGKPVLRLLEKGIETITKKAGNDITFIKNGFEWLATWVNDLLKFTKAIKIPGRIADTIVKKYRNVDELINNLPQEGRKVYEGSVKSTDKYARASEAASHVILVENLGGKLRYTEKELKAAAGTGKHFDRVIETADGALHAVSVKRAVAPIDSQKKAFDKIYSDDYLGRIQEQINNLPRSNTYIEPVLHVFVKSEQEAEYFIKGFNDYIGATGNPNSVKLVVTRIESGGHYLFTTGD